MFVVVRFLSAPNERNVDGLRWCSHTHKTEKTAVRCSRRWAGALGIPLDRFAVVPAGLWSR
jgi:hypothetical protein